MNYKVGKKYKFVSSEPAPLHLSAYFEDNDITDNTIVAEYVHGKKSVLCATVNGKMTPMLLGSRLGHSVFRVPTKFKVGKKYKLTELDDMTPYANIQKHWKHAKITDNTVVVAYIDEAGDAYAHTKFNELMCVLTKFDIKRYGVVVFE